MVWGRFFDKTFFGMGAGFRNENRHETGPQGTDLAENSPILIRIGRGIRFRPPRGPGRTTTAQKRQKRPNNIPIFWGYGTACFLLIFPDRAQHGNGKRAYTKIQEEKAVPNQKQGKFLF